MPTPKAKSVCPIPVDAMPGDIVVHRNGNQHKLTEFRKETCDGRPAWVTGSHQFNLQYLDGTEFSECSDYDCIAFIRQSPKPTPQPEKAARPDKDAVWLLRHAMADSDMAMHFDSYDKRIRAIAKRLNGGKLPVTRKGKS